MPAHRLLTVTAAAVLLAGPAQGELIIISPNTVPIPPFSILKESIRKLNGADVSPARYITFLGTWENNGSANWERETWWGRFYVDCKNETFKVYHFKHKYIGNGWRSINKYHGILGQRKYMPSNARITGRGEDNQSVRQGIYQGLSQRISSFQDQPKLLVFYVGPPLIAFIG